MEDRVAPVQGGAPNEKAPNFGSLFERKVLNELLIFVKGVGSKVSPPDHEEQMVGSTGVEPVSRALPLYVSATPTSYIMRGFERVSKGEWKPHSLSLFMFLL